MDLDRTERSVSIVKRVGPGIGLGFLAVVRMMGGVGSGISESRVELLTLLFLLLCFSASRPCQGMYECESECEVEVLTRETWRGPIR